MSDLELLELAAKASGIEYDAEKSKPHPVHQNLWGLWLIYHRETHQFDPRYWNPLREDGDALRLAVKLRLQITPGTYVHHETSVFRSGAAETHESTTMNYGIEEATRRAIVRAAAEIGKRDD